MGGKNSRISAPPAAPPEFPPAASFQAMSRAGILGSLLQVEENFCSKLSRLHSLLLKPLLGTEPQGPKAKENFRLLQLLWDRFKSLWDFSEENSRILREKLETCGSGGLEDFPTLCQGELFLSLYIQYFVTLANFVVVQGFEWAAKSRSDVGQALKEFQRDLPSGSALGPALLSVFQEPFQDHVRNHLKLLEQLPELLQEEPERAAAAAVEQELRKLESFIQQVLDEAATTRELWRTLGAKFTEVLCVPERRLLEASRTVTVPAVRSQHLLLFDDVLVLIQGNSFRSFDLKLVWVDEDCGEKSTPGSYNLRITTPEATFVLSAKDPQIKAVWRWKLEQAVRQAINGKRDFPLWGRRGDGDPAPARRFFSYAFRAEGRLQGATYEGEWLWGKPHGKGTLKWRDGRNHVGDFRKGLEHGFGISLVPRHSRDHYDCYKCHWSRGQRRGYGICEYGNDLVYKGYFRDDVRHGFGILESSSAQCPFRYTGHWERDRKSGYGVWEDRERGERYIGMWLDDHRHGEGIVVTQSGLCYQRTFHMDKMVGSGILLLEDDSVYEGNFTEDLTFAGKGKIPLGNGSSLEGAPKTRNSCEIQLGLKEFPVENRWPGIFQPFQEFLSSGCREETEESFLGFHVQSSKELRRSREFLCAHGGPEEFSWRNPEQPQEPQELLTYLRKALNSSLHPLGKLLRALTGVFQASYGGTGTNRHLLVMAQAEVKFYAQKIWEFSRDSRDLLVCSTIFPVHFLELQETHGENPGAPEDLQGIHWENLENTRTCPGNGAPGFSWNSGDLRVLQKSQIFYFFFYFSLFPSLQKGSSLVLPLILPWFYPELSMLYMLHHQHGDDLYCQGIMELSLFPDFQLLEFLQVQKHLWPLKELTLTSNQRHSPIKDKCFLSATECLQKLITTVDPGEKLEVLRRTLQELEVTVSRALGREHKLPMDDLLPLLIFVVSRARIQHLGAEIHLIRDLMDPSSQGGMFDFLLTTLESCYQHIQKIRLHPKENSSSFS
ncbi:ALS2 C-terminal-like protein [Sylvia borin]